MSLFNMEKSGMAVVFLGILGEKGPEAEILTKS
jgi:hypothetical protein